MFKVSSDKNVFSYTSGLQLHIYLLLEEKRL